MKAVSTIAALCVLGVAVMVAVAPGGEMRAPGYLVEEVLGVAEVFHRHMGFKWNKVMREAYETDFGQGVNATYQRIMAPARIFALDPVVTPTKALEIVVDAIIRALLFFTVFWAHWVLAIARAIVLVSALFAVAACDLAWAGARCVYVLFLATL